MTKPLSLFLCGLTFCLTAEVMGRPADAASPATVRSVQGEVVATNLTTEPPVIIVRVLLPNKEELIVGATVPGEAQVTRGKRAISFAEIKTGERVVLGYVKQVDGLTARSIHIR